MDPTESPEHSFGQLSGELKQEEEKTQKNSDSNDFWLTFSPRNIEGTARKIIVEKIDGKETIRQHPQACRECDRIFPGAYLRKHLEKNGGKCPNCEETFVSTVNESVKKILDALAETKVKCAKCKVVVLLNDLEEHDSE